MNAPNAPKRRFVLTLTLGADSRDALVAALQELRTEIAMGFAGSSVSGGSASGQVVHLTERPTVTPESYQAELAKYVAYLRASDLER